MKRSLILVLLGVTLASCSATGRKVDQSQLVQFQKGRTTYYEAVAALGAPTSETLHDDGTRQVLYSYTQVQRNIESFIPVLNRLRGGATSEHTQAVLLFDRAGVLTSVTWTGGKDASGYGFESGKKQ